MLALYSFRKTWMKVLCAAIVVLCGLLMPFAIVWFNRTFHPSDYVTFIRWAECWQRDPNTAYAVCNPAANYPFVGLLASAGALLGLQALTNIQDMWQLVHHFRLYLAIFDAINFLLVFAIARTLGLNRPMLTALVVSALPSSWAGAALWAQIDGVSQMFLNLSFLFLAKGFLAGTKPVQASLQSDRAGSMQQEVQNSRPRTVFCWLLASALAMSLLILTKQLVVFSLPVLIAMMALIGLYLWSAGKVRALSFVALAVGLTVALFCLLDRIITVPEGYKGSGYLYVWLGGGSNHGNKISGNGFNIWMLLGRNMWSSSRVPFEALRFGNMDLALTPAGMGVFLYISYLVFLAGVMLRSVWSSLLQSLQLFSEPGRMRLFLGLAALCLGLCNLGFNVLLAGTHERYLFHGYPFLVLGALALRTHTGLVSVRSLVFLLFAASVYGAFVYTQIGTLRGFLFAVHRHEFLATIHLFLLIHLSDIFLKNSCFFVRSCALLGGPKQACQNADDVVGQPLPFTDRPV